MKRKNYRLLSLLFAIPLILVGCGQKSSGEDPKPGPGPSDPAVTSVTIAKPSETVVLDGTRATLKATVAGDDGVSQKVTWSSSNDSVATVTNGVVNFLKVAEQTKVSITAAAVADATKKDSVEFTVEHSPFDLKNSRGNPDTSLFLDDGSFIIEDPQDVALIFADVHDTRWYVEATIQVDSFLSTDPYPKFGFMASERDDGMWTYEQSHQFFYYVDTVAAAQSWTNMNVVTEDNDLVNWSWGTQIGSATASPAVKKGEAFKMGLMRDGNRFYQFYGKATDVTLGVVGTFEYNSFGTQANYVWVGGWATAATVSDPKCIVGDAVNTMYSVPEGISLKKSEEVLFVGETYKLEVLADGLWDKSKLTFTSSDPTIATVSEEGVITAAADKTGEVTITVGFQGTELSAEFKAIVTDDLAFKVDLDGELNDVIWSETVKTNSYLLKKNDQYYVRIYAAKNSKGLYLLMDYVVAEAAKCNPNEWWTWENVEFRLADNNKAWSDQYWVSSMNGGSFVSVGTGQKAEAVFYKALAEGADGLLHGTFEMFVPYGDDCVTKDQATYACFGWAPKTGWQQGANWYAAIDENTLNITANGFAHDGTQCSAENGHAFSAWHTDVEPNCTENGSAHRTCSICGKVETKVLDKVADAHIFDYEHAEITTTPDCMHTGIGTATCTKCGAKEETVLPRDYTKHTDAEYPASHNHCHDCGIGSYLSNPAGQEVNHNFGGWDNPATWFDMGVIAGDFVVTFEFNMKACLGLGESFGPGDSCWRTVLPIVYGEGFNPASHRVEKVWRMDWYGWSEGGFTTAENNGVIPAEFDWNINWEAYSDMDVVLVLTKAGVNVTLDWVWKCNAASGYYQGRSFEYHQGCTLADGAQMGVALTAEWTNITLTKAQLTRG